MNEYWLTLFGADARRIRVIENLLRDRLSAATVFWATTYGIRPAVGAARHLRRENYEAWLDHQRRVGLLVVDADRKLAWLTPGGQAEKDRLLASYYRPHFGNWGWRVNGDRLAARLLLGVQVASEFAHHERRYRPLNIGGGEMALVRQWALSAGPALPKRIYQELTAVLTALGDGDSRLPEALVARLIGYRASGVTRPQLAAQLGVAVGEVTILLRDAWLGLASQLAGGTGPLAQLVGPLIAPTPLSHSATQTLADFRAGLSPATISARRHRKISTIREHLLLGALLMPRAADYRRLLPPASLSRLSATLTGSPASWQFVATGPDPAREFFDFRLYQILRTVTPDGQA